MFDAAAKQPNAKQLIVYTREVDEVDVGGEDVVYLDNDLVEKKANDVVRAHALSAGKAADRLN